MIFLQAFPRSTSLAGMLGRSRMQISRHHVGPRMTQIVVHGDTIYLCGQTAEEAVGAGAQTRAILAKIDTHAPAKEMIGIEVTQRQAPASPGHSSSRPRSDESKASSITAGPSINSSGPIASRSRPARPTKRHPQKRCRLALPGWARIRWMMEGRLRFRQQSGRDRPNRFDLHRILWIGVRAALAMGGMECCDKTLERSLVDGIEALPGH